MIRLQQSITVERTARDCFRYLADFATSEQWDPGVYRAEKTTPGSPAVGTEFSLLVDFAGRRVPVRYRLEEVESDRLLVLQGRGEGFAVRDRILIEPVSPEPACSGRTRIDYQAVVDFTGPAGRVAPLLRPCLNRMGRRAVAGMARALTPSPAPEPAFLDSLGHRMLLPAAWSFTERGYLAMPDKGLSEFVDDQIWVVTGPTSGLGLATASELARLGARLVLVGRDAQRMGAAVDAIKGFSGCARDRVHCFEAELSLVSECHRVAGEIVTAFPEIDGLVNNAGALFAERGETQEGHERCLAINLLAPAALARALFPALQRRHGRVINVSSGGMYMQPVSLDDMQYQRGRYDGAVAYARAKRALVALNEYWAETVAGVDFHGMHPGWAATPGVARSLPGFHRCMARWLRDARMGADTIVWLATTASLRGNSGSFWFDRRPRPTAVLPATAVTADQRAGLVAWLAEQTGRS